MKYILSYILYILGDLISRTTMRLPNAFGYKFYSKIMLWSVNLDVNQKIWKPVKQKKKKR